MMNKKMKFGLFFAGLMLTASAFSMSEHVLQQGVNLEVVLPSNEPQVFPNVFMWTVKGHCTIVSDYPENYISIKALRKTGTVNGVKLSQGEMLSLIVHPDETIHVTADPSAKVELVNTGLNTFKAVCSAD